MVKFRFVNSDVNYELLHLLLYIFLKNKVNLTMEFPTFSFHTYRNTFSARLNATMIAFSLKFLLAEIIPGEKICNIWKKMESMI